RAFRAGQTYRFRASYRASAPVWYPGPVGVAGPLEGEMKVRVVPFAAGLAPVVLPLVPVGGGTDRQALVELAVPAGVVELPLLVRFERGSEEVRRLELCLEVEP